MVRGWRGCLYREVTCTRAPRILSPTPHPQTFGLPTVLPSSTGCPCHPHPTPIWPHAPTAALPGSGIASGVWAGWNPWERASIYLHWPWPRNPKCPGTHPAELGSHCCCSAIWMGGGDTTAPPLTVVGVGTQGSCGSTVSPLSQAPMVENCKCGGGGPLSGKGYACAPVPYCSHCGQLAGSVADSGGRQVHCPNHHACQWFRPLMPQITPFFFSIYFFSLYFIKIYGTWNIIL